MSMLASKETEGMSGGGSPRRYLAQGRASRELRVAATVSKHGERGAASWHGP